MPENEPAFTVTVCQAPDHGYTGILDQAGDYNSHRWPNRLGAWLGLRTIVQTKLPHYAAMGMIEVRYDYRPKPPLKEPTDMTTQTAYSLIAIELEQTDDEEKMPWADYWNGNITANALGIIGPLQVEADNVGKPDILDAILKDQDLAALYAAGQPEPKPGVPISPTAIVALVKITWIHSWSPEGEEWDVEYDLVRIFQRDQFEDTLAAMAPQKAATQPAPA